MAVTLPASISRWKAPSVSASGTVSSSLCAWYRSIRSMPRRLSESSQAFAIQAGASPLPCPGISMPHLVRISTFARAPGRAFSHSPITVSNSPPTWPGAQAE